MTVKTQHNSQEFIGNGVTTDFSVGFPFYNKSDIEVYQRDTDDNVTELVLDVDYTIAGSRWPRGGVIELTDALPNAYILTVNRVVDITQEYNIRNGGIFDAAAMERALDKACMIDQQQQNDLDRTLKFQHGADRNYEVGTLEDDGVMFVKDRVIQTSDVTLTGLKQDIADASNYAQQAANSASASAQYAEQSKQYEEQSKQYAEQSKRYSEKIAETVQEHVGEWSTNPLVTASNQVIPYAGTNQLFRPLSLPYQVDSAAHPNPNDLLPDPATGYAGELVDVSDFISSYELSGYVELKFNSVSDLISSTLVKSGDRVTTGLTRWEIVTYSTYTLPQATKTKEFKTLPIAGGLYAYPLSNLYVEDFCSDSVTADNDDGIGLLASVARDGIKIDPNGKEFRLFANVTGIVAATATPETDNAGDKTKMLYFDGFHNLQFGAGTFYAANQATSNTKMYFPSTLTLINCVDTIFDLGATFEGKGENWGATDSSSGQSPDRRLEFCGTNGGHAIYMGRCDGVTGSPVARKCGSVAAIYFSSTRGIALDSPFANAGSLGYAAYTVDAWVGSLAQVGFDDFHGTINNPRAHAELTLRREDGVQAGSSTYAGKGGVLTEDVGVSLTTTRGYIADMYANGSNKLLGYAFGAGSGSICKSTGAMVRNCQEVAFANCATNDKAICTVTEVDAVVGLTGIMFDNQSSGTSYVTLKGKVRVNNSRVWPGETETLANTSLVASLKVTSGAFAIVDCDARGDESPPDGSVGLIFSLVSNMTSACYGGISIEGGEYRTNGYLIRSKGWGGSTPSNNGLIILGGARIIDLSSTGLDGYISYTNQDDNGVFTYVYHDLRDCFIQTRNWRTLDWSLEGSNLDTLIRIPDRMRNCYSLSNNYDSGERSAKVIGIELSGEDTVVNVQLVNGRTFRSKDITSNAGIVRIAGRVGSYDTSNNELTVKYKLTGGDIRSQFTLNTTYGLPGNF